MRCSTEELEKHFTLLPEELRSVVLSLPKHEAFNELASKYSLNREQLAKVIDETVLVVLGLTKAREYTHELTDALQMPRVEVYPIATYINEHIFKEVREHLKHAYEEGRFGQKEAVSIQETSKET